MELGLSDTRLRRKVANVSTEVETKDAENPGRGWGMFLLPRFMLFLVLYLLSIGPAAVLVDRKVVSEKVAEQVYAPIIWLIGVCEPFENLLGWYITKVWGVN